MNEHGKQEFKSFNLDLLTKNDDYYDVLGSDNSLKNAASVAYAQVFAPHHNWAIRKAVAAGMYTLPTRTQLLEKLNEDGEPILAVLFCIIEFLLIDSITSYHCYCSKVLFQL